MESEAEVRQSQERQERDSVSNIEQAGETLTDLAIVDEELGLGGQSWVTLVKRNRLLNLPWTRLRAGSPVVLSSDDESESPQQGVVNWLCQNSIQVSVNRIPDGQRFRLDLSVDEITRKRQKAAIETASQIGGRAGELREVLLGDRYPQFQDLPDLHFSTSLNDSQQLAVRFAIAANDLAIIHGPPGTGKTTTIVELILQAVGRGQSVLACAPSNTAVDNLLDKLATARLNVVRIGHPARVDESLREFTLDAKVGSNELMGIVKDMVKEAKSLDRQVRRYTRAKPAPGSKQEMRKESRRLRSDARLLEQQVVEVELRNASVVCATTSFNADLLGKHRFDLVVIDEACQATEPGCWIPILRADKVVLAGDHCQLPPTVVSAEAKQSGLSTSLLERLVATFGESVTSLLEVQYRMHQEIMGFSSAHFYHGKLIADESVASHTLLAMLNVDLNSSMNKPVTFIDTAGAGWDEEIESGGSSRRNPSEGEFVLRKVSELLDAGLKSEDIAVITPYAAQVRWLRAACENSNLEIDTVDGFQGREKEAVLISCVRSNAQGEIGFLADNRRMNVAMTRARRKLIVVGDSATIGGSKFFSELLAYFESIDAYTTIWEEGVWMN
jgi:ATP-dependent RNA/DNA helicase IGHMBP2